MTRHPWDDANAIVANLSGEQIEEAELAPHTAGGKAAAPMLPVMTPHMLAVRGKSSES
jgi:hypothetical protein